MRRWPGCSRVWRHAVSCTTSRITGWPAGSSPTGSRTARATGTWRDRPRAAGQRLFRADRIAGPVEAEDRAGAFERPEGVPSGPPPPWRLGDDEEIVVDLRVGPSQAAWARAMAGEAAVVGTSGDGTTQFRLAVTNRQAFRGFVLGLLEHAEVVGPPEVREEVVSWLAALAGPEAWRAGLEPVRGSVPVPRAAAVSRPAGGSAGRGRGIRAAGQPGGAMSRPSLPSACRGS